MGGIIREWPYESGILAHARGPTNGRHELLLKQRDCVIFFARGLGEGGGEV